MRLLIFQGSPRNQNNCPDQRSKTSRILRECLKRIPEGVEVDLCDLSVRKDRPIVQPCKGCVSTANGFHCHWPCTCYFKGDSERPDLMHDWDIYRRLQECDGFMVFCPVHWFAVPTQVKAMFDRLVCANLTLTAKQAEKLGTDKNSKITTALEKSGKLRKFLRNHLEGKYGAFFVHGDDGADDYEEEAGTKGGDRKPLPDSFWSQYDKYSYGVSNFSIQAVMPIVWQCRYSGIIVPEECVEGLHFNKGVSYAKANEQPLDEAVEKASAVLGRLVEKLK